MDLPSFIGLVVRVVARLLVGRAATLLFAEFLVDFFIEPLRLSFFLFRKFKCQRIKPFSGYWHAELANFLSAFFHVLSPALRRQLITSL